VKTLCASIREKYDQPWVLFNILELNVDREELDDLDEYANPDKVLFPNDQATDEEIISEEPPYLVHALDKNLEDHTSLRK
jgi:hypothetical protein